MSALTEKLAQALWNAEKPYWTENNPFGVSVPWPWSEADEGMRDVYRRIAVKVAAELGFTEEKRIDIPGRRGINPVRRWVSAWSEVE